MFNSTIIDVAAGVVFAFLAISLAASSINEAIASFLNRRATGLLGGIRKLLNDFSEDGIVLQIYNHALTHPQGDGAATTVGEVNRPLPAYMDSGKFAIALIEGIATLHAPAPDAAAVVVQATATDATADATVTVSVVDATPPTLDQALMNIPDPQLRRTLQGLYARANGEMIRFEAAVADWFDAGMDRVSGAYKRYSQLWAFLIALGLAVLLNVDAINIAKVLWLQPSLAKGITGAPIGSAAEVVAELGKLGLPVGWTGWPIGTYFAQDLTLLGWLTALTGWLITALATLFGAPFWFDLLQRVVKLRGAGPAPGDKT